MPKGAITEYIDVAQLALYVFWIFFFGLIVYIRREDRREGYPAEHDLTGTVRKKSWILDPAPKEYKLAHGEGSVFLPSGKRDPVEVPNTRRLGPWPGAALVPTGDAMADGLGAAAYAQRTKRPELDLHGHLLVIPLRSVEEFSIAPGTRDPRGFVVRGCDDVVVGKVTDVWLDRAEQEVRHLEVDLENEGKTVLLPIAYARVEMDRPRVNVAAITGAQFASVPSLAKGEEITNDEEERIQAYYGGGYMYANPNRAEPFV